VPLHVFVCNNYPKQQTKKQQQEQQEDCLITTMSKSPSLRRIKADIRELSIDPSDQYYAAPLETGKVLSRV